MASRSSVAAVSQGQQTRVRYRPSRWPFWISRSHRTRSTGCILFVSLLARERQPGRALRKERLDLMRLARLCLLVFFAVCGMACTTFANTTAQVTASASVSNSPIGPVSFGQTELDEDLSAASAKAAAVAIGDMSGSSNGRAFATYGDIGLDATADACCGSDAKGSSGGARLTATAGYQDVIVLSVPLLPRGEEIKIRVALNISGSFSARATSNFDPVLPPHSSQGIASGFLDVTAFNSNGSLDTSGGCINSICGFRDFRPLGDLGPDFTPVDTDISTPESNVVVWGLPNNVGTIISVNARLFVEAGAGRSTEASILGFFRGSIHWGGIQSVTNGATGEVLTDWTITSDSGFDYSKPFPVPEPSSIVLLGMALCARLARARSRR
jgi:hypothetical protein